MSYISPLNPQPVTGTFWQTTQPVSIADTVNVEITGPLDSSTSALKTITYAHHEAHDARFYSIRQIVASLGAGADLDILIVTPDTTRETHWGYNVVAKNETTLNFYEDTTTSAPGTPVVGMNHLRSSGNVAGTLVYTAPTVSGVGTLLPHSVIFGSGKSYGGNAGTSEELILDRASQYMLRIHNNAVSAGWISWEMAWYEHVPDA